jgi:hypothetical protein
MMVAALSVSWGVDSDRDGLKVVWSELSRSGLDASG